MLTSGAVYCWGYNYHGALGDGTTTNRLLPTQVTVLGNSASEIEAGDAFTCALKVDGSVWCWGTNYAGQVGNGTFVDQWLPVQVSGLGADVVGLTAGPLNTCARKRDATLWCWGGNPYGELGDNTTSNRNAPVRASVLDTVLDASAGLNHTCATRPDGSTWCWGKNHYGQLGNGTTVDSTAAVPVSNGDSCPTKMDLLTEPIEGRPDRPMFVHASAYDPSGPVRFSWVAPVDAHGNPVGSFANPGAPNTTYLCNCPAGHVTCIPILQVTASNRAGCSSTSIMGVNCRVPAPSVPATPWLGLAATALVVVVLAFCRAVFRTATPA